MIFELFIDLILLFLRPALIHIVLVLALRRAEFHIASGCYKGTATVLGELIYGKGDEPEAPEEVSGDGTSANNAVHLKNLRGKGRLARLKILFCVMAAICVFCVIVVAVLFVRNEWISHSDKNGNVRVEKVYQQYTKADLAYLDDNGRKIMDTVWLDVPGVRDGDYIQLYTGVDGDGLFLNYKTSTIVAASFVMLVFIILLILIGLEIRRMKKEDTLQIILEDKTADEKM